MNFRTIRNAITKDPRKGIAVAGGVFLLAIIILILTSGESVRDVRNRTQLWYFDLNTKERYPVDYHATVEVPPQDAPSGPLKEDTPVLKAGSPAGVRLYRFACGSCSNEQFDGYLKTFSLVAQKKWIEEKVSYSLLQDHVLVRRLTDENWVPEHSDEAKKILMEPVTRCRKINQRPRACEVND